MKKIYTTALTVAIGMLNAQIIIGDAVGTAPAGQKTSVLLEFAAGQNKGIVLPYLRTVPSSPAEGTIALDASNVTDARIKYFNGAWVDLSGQNGDVSSALGTQPTVSQVTETVGAKAIIGSDTTAVDGILVLESSTKAMVLPTVDDVQNIINPAPGMMVYVNKAGAKRLAVFNGTRWSFWKATL
ncbi:hypothetical protein ASG31_10280 [Chryseobacterium sp. Leaf404]|uniref:hypothetical protein n=1 Tax=unclassified Chryseobacterium TaxID=2593645 RepID=UPI000700DA3E|nr:MULTISPECIES: hypothetical protein [unclassified Chryseobacterium]KQT16759.1 hypothetical protein ASG31_10280 [Chryseobacterium sp. Leaf404]